MRTAENKILPILPFLYDILLIVENDESNYEKGYNWGFVKTHIKRSRIEDSPIKISRILSGSDDCCLNLKKGGSLASKFLKSVRDAFAHNSVKYDEEKEIVIFDDENNKTRKLSGTIKLDSLKELISLIKESKIQNNKTIKEV